MRFWRMGHWIPLRPWSTVIVLPAAGLARRAGRPAGAATPFAGASAVTAASAARAASGAGARPASLEGEAVRRALGPDPLPEGFPAFDFASLGARAGFLVLGIGRLRRDPAAQLVGRRVPQLHQSVEGRLHHVVRVGRAEGLR